VLTTEDHLGSLFSFADQERTGGSLFHIFESLNHHSQTDTGGTYKIVSFHSEIQVPELGCSINLHTACGTVHALRAAPVLLPVATSGYILEL